MSDTNPTTVYGLPKTVETEVCSHPTPRPPWVSHTTLQFRLLSKPCSVVRDITLKTLGKLDAASDKSSFHSRMVLSMENCSVKLMP
jgi:small subunit ribosomal protein S29